MAEQKLETLDALASVARLAESAEEAQRAVLQVLAGHRDELSRELAELDRLRREATESERAARQTTQEAAEARRRFMDNVSHELRTPLNGILGFLDLLSEGIGGDLTEAQEQRLQRIHAGAVRLKEIIEEIITFFRLEAGRETATLEETDLGALLSAVAAVVRHEMEEKGLTFRVTLPDSPTTVRTDGEKVRKILMHLLSNAREYTEQGSVELRAERDAREVRIVVEDTGPGIAIGDREKVFQPLQRSPAYAGEGPGLGLGISRSLAALLGGDLTVGGEPGKGSAFVLHLPWARDERVARPAWRSSAL